jgi:hypothetical protein
MFGTINKPNTAAVNSILFVRAIYSMFVNCVGQQRRLYTGLKMSDHRGRGGPQAGGPGTHTLSRRQGREAERSVRLLVGRMPARSRIGRKIASQNGEGGGGQKGIEIAF